MSELKEIDLNTLEPGFETDRIICAILNVDYDDEYGRKGEFQTDNLKGAAVATLTQMYPKQRFRGYARNDKECWCFNPSTELNDAFWAADKFNLFDGPTVLRKSTDGWEIGTMEIDDATLDVAARSTTIEMAICIAILNADKG